jgi:hypothetical protein
MFRKVSFSIQQEVLIREISSSHGGEYDVPSCLLGCTAVKNDFTRQYNPEDSSEHQVLILLEKCIYIKCDS